MEELDWAEVNARLRGTEPPLPGGVPADRW